MRQEVEEMRNRRLGLLVITFILGFVMVWTPVMAADTIKLGCLSPLTGPYAALGDSQKKNVELAVELYNKEGGVLGKKVEVQVRDSQMNPGVALRKAQELVFDQKVDYLVGTLSSSVVKVISEFSAKNKILYMGFPQTEATGKDINRYAFTGMVSPFMCAMAISKYAFQNHGKKWYALTADYVWGHNLLKSWIYSSQINGGEFLGNTYAPLGASDFSAFLPKIIAANPDFVVFNNLGRDQNAALKQAHEMGIIGKKKIFCSKTEITTMKEIYPIYDENVFGGVTFYWELQDKYPAAKKYVKAFWEKYNEPPLQDGEAGFFQVMALLDAIKRAKTTDTEAVIKALEDGKYTLTKGEEYYQKCNHQRVTSQIILRGKGKRGEGWSMAEVVAEIPARDIMRNCDQAIKDLPLSTIELPK